MKTVKTFTWLIVVLGLALAAPFPVMADCGCQPGTGTPGYWKNHCDAWPVEAIIIGGVTYEKADAIMLMQMPVKGDKGLTLFKALVAAKLNVMIGNHSECVDCCIADADAWMAANFSCAVPASSCAWKEGEPLYLCLDAYNNGRLCAPSRDICE